MARRHLTLRSLAGVLLAAVATYPASAAGPPARDTPLSMVEALHTAFGEHHNRAVHTKGAMLEGSSTPAPGARALTTTPVFRGSPPPVVARFSLFAGVPTLPDGDDFDVEANQHRDFITATFEFAEFLRGVGAAGKGDPAPLNAFLASHLHARAFLASRTYPASYAGATYFGVNALRFTDARGRARYVRYQFTPHDAERYISPAERKAAGPAYLGDELQRRAAAGPITFDWWAQIAGPGDRIDDPSTAWPDTRRRVKLGVITLTRSPVDPELAQRRLLFLPGQPHPGVEPADPMLVMRNAAYPISLGQRR